MRRIRLAGLALAVLTTVMITGCGTSSAVNSTNGNVSGQATNAAAGSAGQDANPPFANRLKDLPATPDPQFDATSVSAATYGSVTVYDANGSKVILDAKKTPILFVAYWCPHCQRTLVLLNAHRQSLAQFPTLVSMGFAPGTSLSEAVSITHQEMSYFHIQNVKEYYYLGSKSQTLVPQGYPTLVFPSQGSVSAMFGEHTIGAWQQAMHSQ
ncbi:hypothetical protein JZ785_24570 [Alicyclobacillus curvatus]|nr:hypothetical protein JZ785_24570 [Alicyclobacillus curvatus]